MGCEKRFSVGFSFHFIVEFVENEHSTYNI